MFEELTSNRTNPLAEIDLIHACHGIEKVTLAPDLAAEDCTPKVTRNALAIQYIGEVWHEISQWRKQNPKSLITSKNTSPLEIVSHTDLVIALSSTKHGVDDLPKSTANELYVGMLNLTSRISDAWEKRHRAEFTAHLQVGFGEDDIKYQRFCKLYHGEAHDPANVRAEPIFKPMPRGFGTGLRFMWGTIGVISETFEAKFNRTATAQEFSEILESVSVLTARLMKTHVAAFLALEEVLTTEHNRGKAIFKSECFTIESHDNPNRLSITLKSGLISNLSFDTEDDEDVVTGCPAVYAPGVNKSRMITEFFDWVSEVAREVYIPVLSKTK